MNDDGTVRTTQLRTALSLEQRPQTDADMHKAGRPMLTSLHLPFGDIREGRASNGSMSNLSSGTRAGSCSMAVPVRRGH